MSDDQGSAPDRPDRVGGVESNEIGERVRAIRRRRGLSQDTVAGLAGVTGAYVSMIETGRRRIDSRGLLDRLADALGCSVLDLTGEPYVPASRGTADALLAVPTVQLALADTSLTDVPDDEPVRPLEVLARLAANGHAAYLDRTDYAAAASGLGALLVELHVHAVTGPARDQPRASRALTLALMTAFGITKNLGHPDLALMAAQRGHDVALRAGDPGPLAFAGQRFGQALQRVGAERRAGTVLRDTLADADAWADPSAADTTAAEGAALAHLTAALGAARGGRRDDALTHLGAARELGERMGERNAMGQHVGPANLGVWTVTIGAELGDGARAVEHLDDVDVGALASADRVTILHTDAARALAQEDGARDGDAVRHLDRADRAGAARIRQDPVARELVATLAGRARRPSWELRSLRNRFGLAGVP